MFVIKSSTFCNFYNLITIFIIYNRKSKSYNLVTKNSHRNILCIIGGSKPPPYDVSIKKDCKIAILLTILIRDDKIDKQNVLEFMLHMYYRA